MMAALYVIAVLSTRHKGHLRQQPQGKLPQLALLTGTDGRFVAIYCSLVAKAISANRSEARCLF